MTTPVNPVDGLLAAIACAVEEWKGKNTAENIKKTVTDLLDSESKQLTLKLLGFDDRWGKWEVDHCNGRSGESAAGAYLRDIQKTAIQDWFEAVSMPTITPALKKQLGTQLQKTYEEQLAYSIRKAVVVQADADAQELVKQLTVSNQAENYLKVLTLLNPEIKTD